MTLLYDAPEVLSLARDTELLLKSGDAPTVQGRSVSLTRRSRRGPLRIFHYADFAARLRHPQRRTASGVEQVKPLTREGDREFVTGADFITTLEDGTHLMAGQRAHEISLRSDLLDLDDLGVIIGAPSDVQTGEENAQQAAINAAYDQIARERGL